MATTTHVDLLEATLIVAAMDSGWAPPAQGSRKKKITKKVEALNTIKLNLKDCVAEAMTLQEYVPEYVTEHASKVLETVEEAMPIGTDAVGAPPPVPKKMPRTLPKLKDPGDKTNDDCTDVPGVLFPAGGGGGPSDEPGGGGGGPSDEEEDVTMYCPVCLLWLNGPAQWEDHQQGKKHHKSLRRAARARARGPAAEPEAEPEAGPR